MLLQRHGHTLSLINVILTEWSKNRNPEKAAENTAHFKEKDYSATYVIILLYLFFLKWPEVLLKSYFVTLVFGRCRAKI